ncbi:hypothetical protein MPH_12645 [Macrophomina phaseolina MS6]|uniref:Uncharacterized protein n=1 Tax=Macrophomina phaseolina (strain MS6) TaxID=1126212 RepID=K2R7H5_MACPH|nr:hypothetical protein MPH_12645 [Macrophomina phaseolina MS6]
MQDKPPVIEIVQYGSNDEYPQGSSQRLPAQPPLRLKVISTLLVCLMGFGTYYNQGLLGAVKTPLKKVEEVRTLTDLRTLTTVSRPCTSTTCNSLSYSAPKTSALR